VASQVLAIRAQTDLNSAERENTNIRATMSSQLQTLRSEFERLSVNLVASGENITVSRGVQEVIKLLTNGMRVLSDHPTILSAIIALLVMMAAKLALVAVNMEQAEGKGNFFLNTVKQITLAVRTMGEAMEKANKEMAEAGGFFQMAGEKAEGATIGLLANVGSLATAWNTLKTVGTFVLSTIASLAGQIIWFVIISAAIWAINKAFEYFQGAAQKATDQMAGLNDQIERSNNLGNAAAQSARLMQTIEKAVPNLDDKGFEKAAHGVAEIAYPDAGDDRKRQALEDELETMREQGRYEEIQAKLEQMRTGYLATANVNRQEALRLTQQQLAVEQQALENLRAQIDAKDKMGRPADREREELREVQDRINALNEKRAQNYDEIVDDATSTEESPLAKLMDAQVKGLEKGLEDFSSKIATNGTATDKLKEEIQLLDAKKTLLDQNADAAKYEYNVAEDAAQARIAAAKAALAASRDPEKDEALQNLVQARDRARARLDADQARLAVAKQDIDDIGMDKWFGMGRFLYSMSWLPGSHTRSWLEPYDDPGIDKDEKAYGKYASGPQRFEDRNAEYFATLKEKQTALDAANKAEQESTKDLQAKSQALDDATQKQRESIDADREQAEAQLRLADAMEKADAGSADAKNVGLTGKFGRNEGEKIWNEAQAVYGSLSKDFADEIPAWQAKVSTQADLLAEVQTEAGIREKLKTLRDSELAAAQRQAELEAEIRQEMIKQNEEASKALLMGTRQEQMQATMIARFLQRRGGQGFSTNEFMFLDSDTREAIAKFFPSAAPTGAGTDMDKLLQERAELPEIQRRLAQERAAAESTFGGVDPTGTAARYAGLDKLQQPAVPEIALNVGGVHVDIGDQFAQLTTQFQNVVAQQLQPQLNKMSDRIAALERANAVTNAGARS
jgi:hypothetical protein